MSNKQEGKHLWLKVRTCKVVWEKLRHNLSRTPSKARITPNKREALVFASLCCSIFYFVMAQENFCGSHILVFYENESCSSKSFFVFFHMY